MTSGDGIFAKKLLWVVMILFLSMGFGCGGGGGSGGSSGGGGSSPGGDDGPAAPAEFVVLAWNDLGMHCLNPTYDELVILPPYNTVWAQVIEKGDPPRIVTDGITVEYAMVNNTSSADKRDYGQFWEFDTVLFGVDLDLDTGLNLVEPDLNNGLSGLMQPAGDHFQVDGIPVTPVDDQLNYSAYQVMEIIVKDESGLEIAQTRATVPTSDEINCAKCHGQNAFQDILEEHDDEAGTNLLANQPVLCAECHGSPALLAPPEGGRGSAGSYLSEAIHGSHANRGAACYDCHPGDTTTCNRSLAHDAPDGNCITCHSTMAEMAAAMNADLKIPWVDEPACADCHAGIAEVDTGSELYRNATGHGGVYCAACHQSPHAMIPSREATDNYQALQYQESEKSIASCGACHELSKGPADEFEEFIEEHGGSDPEEESACHICHTVVRGDSTAAWPHAFQWEAR